MEVAGIVGSSPDKSHAAAERLGVSAKYSSLSDALKDSDVDAIHLTTPTYCTTNKSNKSSLQESIACAKNLWP